MPTEREQRLQSLWERATARAIEMGGDSASVYGSMLAAAATGLVNAAQGPDSYAALASYFGTLSTACEAMANGDVCEPINPPTLN